MQMKNLNDFTPLEASRQKSFVSEENGRKHIGANPDQLSCRRYRVDGYILTEKEGKKCDFLLINDEGKHAYFIELKGSHINVATEQIDATVAALKDSLRDYKFFKRIICSKARTLQMQGSTINQWKFKNKGNIEGQPIAVIVGKQYTDTMIR